jgi:hypothetical protein
VHDDPMTRRASTEDQEARRQTRSLRIWAMIVLIPVAVIGAALSFQSLYRAAEPVFGPRLALGFPLLVDFLILGTSLQYVAGAKIGRPRAGWRWTAHAGVAATLLLNGLAAHSLREVPWHVTAPAVWSVLVELTAREFLGQWRAAHAPLGDHIPLRLWLTAPVESSRTWLRIARRVEGEQALARLDVGVHAAAVEALKLALPQRRARRVRRILRRQLRAGSLPPSAVLGPLGWMDDAQALVDVTPASVLRAALRDTLRRTEPPTRPAPAGAAPQPVAAVEAAPPAPAVEAAPPARAVEAAPAQAPPRRPSVTRPTPEIAVRTPPVGADHLQPAERPGTASSGDRLADAVDIVRVHETISAAQLATQLRALGWQLSDRTAARILAEAREHLMRADPWALPTP